MIGLLAKADLSALLQSPLTWGLAVGALGLWILLDAATTGGRWLGQMLGIAGLATLFISLPTLSALETFDQWTSQIIFWLLATISIVCSAAAVTVRNPVYTAIWFAASLVGVSGLFLFNNAQFLGVSTIVVYAGAIVVTFLFVLMLASPEGNARYDRVGWATFSAPLTIATSLALVAVIASAAADEPVTVTQRNPAVESAEHMAGLGAELFSRHLIAVEVVGTILLVAMVGAVAIVIQGKQTSPTTDSSRVNSRTPLSTRGNS